MKKLLLPVMMLAAFSVPVFAQTNTEKSIEPYPGLEGLDCIALVEKLNVTLEEVQISDELKVEIVELREQGITEKQTDNEQACVSSLTVAFQLLVPSQ